MQQDGRSRREALRWGLGGLIAGAGPVRAADFPNRPLRLLIPYAAGGGSDIVGRTAAERLGARLGQTVVPENRPGANTLIAAQQLLTQPADGHTLMLAGAATLVVNPLLYRRLPYDAARDLTCLCVTNSVPLVVVVRADSPVRDLAGLAARAKALGDRMAFASNGLGNPTHLAAEMFRLEAGVELTHVVFNGSPPALAAILSGDIEVMFDVVGSSLPLIQGGRLRALAVVTAQRLAVLPEVPTVAESGYPGYAALFWYGIAALARTPPELLLRLNGALNAVLADPGYQAVLAPLGLAPEPPRDLAAIAAFIAEDSARWGRVIRARGIVLE